MRHAPLTQTACLLVIAHFASQALASTDVPIASSVTSLRSRTTFADLPVLPTLTVLTLVIATFAFPEPANTDAWTMSKKKLPRRPTTPCAALPASLMMTAPLLESVLSASQAPASTDAWRTVPAPSPSDFEPQSIYQ